MKRLIIFAAALLAGCAEQEARDAVAAQLKDPGSAQFRNVKVTDKGACGEVNGKNLFGAYVGFREFVYRKENGRVEIFDPEDPDGKFVQDSRRIIFDLERAMVC